MWYTYHTIICAGAVKQHPNREAPRCLPCDLVDPLLDQPNGRDACAAATTPTQFLAPRVCPCTPAVLCRADTGAIFNKSTCSDPTPKFVNEGQPQCVFFFGGYAHNLQHYLCRYPHMGWWYMLHGGAGAIMSVGLMQRATFHDMHEFFVNHPPQSGGAWLYALCCINTRKLTDALISRGIWHKMGIAPTDPGYGYCRPHIQMFDPGWRGYRARGPEDAGTADGGADSTGLIARSLQGLLLMQAHRTVKVPACHRMELYLADACDDVCRDQVAHTLSVHVRGKYASADFLGGDVSQQADVDGQPHFRSAVFVINKLGQLFARVARKRVWLQRAGSSRTA